MPPSPTLRFSPSRDVRAENHKRGPAKLRYFSDFKLGISIPVRGESSDLLTADGDKNDYDWLLTPPDTPLFPSLDDDDDAPPAEKSYATSRSSASPHRLSPSPRSGCGTFQTSRSSPSPRRLSPSPRSGNSAFQSRGRPSSSAPHGSPTPVVRSTTPSRRPSTPPNKPASPVPRSSTPTLRRTSMGSSGNPSTSGRRGTSPGRPRGNSASPKLQAWQSTLPGFSSEPPPNLRTSISDRSASRTRGLSPASRNGGDSSAKFGRQSMSPTASRSASSSHSHDRDHLSSQSKGSIASSADDDLDSLHSGALGIPESPTMERYGSFPNNRILTFSKRPSRTLSSSSAPKRSFDSALRQMENRKTPQNMFRPLLSSVPATTFYVGKASSVHRSMVSENFSVTTSSNESYVKAVGGTPDTDGSLHDHNDLTTELANTPYPGAQEEALIFDEVDEINEDSIQDISDAKPRNGHASLEGKATSEVGSGEPEKLNVSQVSVLIASTASQSLQVTGGNSDSIDGHETMAICRKCGRKFHVIDDDDAICEDCAQKGKLSISETVEANVSVNSMHSDMVTEVSKFHGEVRPGMNLLELPEKSTSQPVPGQQEKNTELVHAHLPGNSPLQLAEGGQVMHQNSVGHQTISSNQPDSKDQQSKSFNTYPSIKVDGSEGAGISVLLKRSSSWKWPVVQGRTFMATNIPCDDPSYARDSLNVMRSNSLQGTASASSSIDLGSSRQTEARVLRQSSSKKVDLESSRDDSVPKHLSTRSSFSGISYSAYETYSQDKSSNGDKLADSLIDVNFEGLEQKLLVAVEQGRALGSSEGVDKLSDRAVLGGDKIESSDSCRIADTSASEFSSHAQSSRLEETSSAELLNDDECVSSGNAEVTFRTAKGHSNIEAESSVIEESILQSDGVNTSDVPVHELSTALGESEDDHDSCSFSQTDCATSPNSKSIVEAFREPLGSGAIDSLILGAALENNPGHHCDIDEESMVVIPGPAGQRSRSFTLDEATDTILFCSSIIHDLAYQAATIAMEKDSPSVQASRPTVTIFGKSDSSRKELRARTSSKRTHKSQKLRQRRLDTEPKTASPNAESEVKTLEPLANNSEVPNKVDSAKPPKLESKCNCTVIDFHGEFELILNNFAHPVRVSLAQSLPYKYALEVSSNDESCT
ncbi:hypothetical protein ACLOJK_009098 [Asimina triloba]